MSSPFVDTVVLRDFEQRASWSLRFPPELEAEYHDSMAPATRRWVRMSVLLALSTVLGFAVIDHWVLTRPASPLADSIRFGLQLPIVLMSLFLTTEGRYKRWYVRAITIGAPLFGIGTVVLAATAPAEQVSLITGRILLAAFYYFVVTPAGLLLRVLGRDPMKRRFDRAAKSYWRETEKGIEPERYFRQF